MTPPRPLAHRVVRAWAGALLHGFYRIEFHGPPLAADAPVLLIANHQNGLADGALLLLATERPLRVLVKYQLLAMPLLGLLFRSLGALPVYRQKDGVDRSQNRAAFGAVHAALAARSAVALFPEGSSHSEPRLAELKTGVARLALGALAEHGAGIGLQIVPVGLWYAARDRCGSRVLVVRGAPIDPRPYLSADGAEDRAAVARLMERVRVELEQVSAALPAGLDRGRFDAALGRLARGGAQGPGLILPLAARLRLRAAQGGPRWSRIVRRLGALPPAPQPAGASLWSRCCWWPPAWLASALAKRLRPTADKHVTTLLLAATPLFPLWWLALIWLSAGSGALGLAPALLLPGLAAWGRFAAGRAR